MDFSKALNTCLFLVSKSPKSAFKRPFSSYRVNTVRSRSVIMLVNLTLSSLSKAFSFRVFLFSSSRSYTFRINFLFSFSRSSMLLAFRSISLRCALHYKLISWFRPLASSSWLYKFIFYRSKSSISWLASNSLFFVLASNVFSVCSSLRFWSTSDAHF